MHWCGPIAGAWLGRFLGSSYSETLPHDASLGCFLAWAITRAVACSPAFGHLMGHPHGNSPACAYGLVRSVSYPASRAWALSSPGARCLLDALTVQTALVPTVPHFQGAGQGQPLGTFLTPGGVRVYLIQPAQLRVLTPAGLTGRTQALLTAPAAPFGSHSRSKQLGLTFLTHSCGPYHAPRAMAHVPSHPSLHRHLPLHSSALKERADSAASF